MHLFGPVPEEEKAQENDVLKNLKYNMKLNQIENNQEKTLIKKH